MAFRLASSTYFREATPRARQGVALPKRVVKLNGKAQPFRTAKRQAAKACRYSTLRSNSRHYTGRFQAYTAQYCPYMDNFHPLENTFHSLESNFEALEAKFHAYMGIFYS
jgi:acetyl-CoA carboxylase carboxyltransferase component